MPSTTSVSAGASSDTAVPENVAASSASADDSAQQNVSTYRMTFVPTLLEKKATTILTLKGKLHSVNGDTISEDKVESVPEPSLWKGLATVRDSLGSAWRKVTKNGTRKLPKDWRSRVSQMMSADFTAKSKFKLANTECQVEFCETDEEYESVSQGGTVLCKHFGIGKNPFVLAWVTSDWDGKESAPLLTCRTNETVNTACSTLSDDKKLWKDTKLGKPVAYNLEHLYEHFLKKKGVKDYLTVQSMLQGEDAAGESKATFEEHSDSEANRLKLLMKGITTLDPGLSTVVTKLYLSRNPEEARDTYQKAMSLFGGPYEGEHLSVKV